MSKHCIGCGVLLQSEDKQALGYTPKEEATYCQRCFRIQHYDDVTISMKQGIDPDQVLSKIASYDALLLWVIDLYDFEANLIHGLNRHLLGKDVVLIATKRDLLPDTIGNQKLCNFIQARLKAVGISVRGIVICGDLVKHAMSEDNGSIEEVDRAIDMYRNDRDVLVMGMANAGKSTLLNAYLGKKELTTSRYPGTTLDVVAIPQDEYTLYDTPGLTRQDSLLTIALDEQLKDIIPAKPLKAQVYQLRNNQSLAVAGLARLDLFGCEQATCVGYFSDRLKIHRGKQENADALWLQHMQELLKPALNNDFHSMQKFTFPALYEKTDVVIHGLGWFCVSGNIEQMDVYVPCGVNVTFRKAMI